MKKEKTIDPIQRSVTVSAKRNGIFMAHENGILEIWKNKKLVIKLHVADLKKFLKVLK